MPESSASDEILLSRLQAGDESALGILVKRYERELFHYLKRYLGDIELAEDVFQNVFLQVFRKRHSFDANRRFRPWLYTVATHQAVDAQRRQRRHTRLSLESTKATDADGNATSLGDLVASDVREPIHRAIRAEQSQQVRAAVDALAEHLKPVVIMAYFQGLKYQDIADVLEIPVGTVKSRLFAAVQRLQETWGREIGRPNDE